MKRSIFKKKFSALTSRTQSFQPTLVFNYFACCQISSLPEWALKTNKFRVPGGRLHNGKKWSDA